LVDLILDRRFRGTKKLSEHLIPYVPLKPSITILRKLFEIINDVQLFASSFLSCSIVDPEIISKIKASGFNLSALLQNNQTALQSICSKLPLGIHLKAVQLLIENGAEVETPSDKCSALAQAIRRSNETLAIYLLDQGASVEKAMKFNSKSANQRFLLNTYQRYKELLFDYRWNWVRYWYLMKQGRAMIDPYNPLYQFMSLFYFRLSFDLFQFIISQLQLPWEIIKTKKVYK